MGDEQHSPSSYLSLILQGSKEIKSTDYFKVRILSEKFSGKGAFIVEAFERFTYISEVKWFQISCSSSGIFSSSERQRVWTTGQYPQLLRYL